MRPPVTIIERLASAGSLLLILLLIVAVGLWLLSRISRSPARLLHGRFVLCWTIAGWIIGSCVGVSLLNNQQYRPAEADVGFAGLGLLAGWLLGSIHGGIIVWLRSRPGA